MEKSPSGENIKRTLSVPSGQTDQSCDQQSDNATNEVWMEQDYP